jgi:peptidoglycan hydrolase-like protein with peptidoglycan-binding domain
MGGLYQRPIEPLGELAGNPPHWQVLLFRQLSRPYGATLVSWWDWQAATAADWTAISQPFPNLQGFTIQSAYPTLSVASAGGISVGDLVVWAQEHLLEAGEAVKTDGSFGSGTQLAVQAFQTAHGLPVTGMIDQPTWQALLRYPRPSVVWTSATAPSAHRAADRATAHRFTLPVPWSARLPARGYEIPRDLGAGRRPR